MDEEFFRQVRREREYQREKWGNDAGVSIHLWGAFISNYATRYSDPASFDNERYRFCNCMVKVAALALAGWEWYMKQPEEDLPC